MELEKLKTKIQEEVENHRHELVELSLKIHDNPEVGWQERKASTLLTDYLERNGFTVERGICELPTAFRASYGKGKPTIVFLSEYDSTTETEHGCGHNIIGTCGVGAGMAAKIAADRFGARILVLGAPAEERLGGKVIMVGKGAFDEVDVAIMVHPIGQHNGAGGRTLASIFLDVEFWGREAHAAGRGGEGAH